jgi:carboxymethylenebutenolidase
MTSSTKPIPNASNATAPVVKGSTLQTSAEGLIAGPVTYTVDGFSVPAYRAVPANKANTPIVIVVQEIFGLHPYIAGTCRRLAHAGYMAVAPELYARQGDASAYTDIPVLMSGLVSKVPDAQVIADLDGAIAWAKAQGADATRVAMTGFCWGGRITWLYCAQRAIQAGVAWYGRLAGIASANAPRHPIDIAATLQTPVLGLYGGQDTGIPLDTVHAMQKALAEGASAASLASGIVVYPDAPHAFHADYRSGYRKADAEDGFRRMLEWFAVKGVA